MNRLKKSEKVVGKTLAFNKTIIFARILTIIKSKPSSDEESIH